MRKRLIIDIEADSSHVTEAELEDHVDYIYRDIGRYAETQMDESFNRKINVSYDEMEDVGLRITVKEGDT